MNRGTVIIDIGKTNAKVSLWDANSGLLAREVRANSSQQTAGYRALDVDALDAWVLQSLSHLARQAEITRIVPVGHGAAAVLITPNGLFCPPMDYEDEPTHAERLEYTAQRDGFELTGSPPLPCGLNLGMQLHRLENIYGRLPQHVTIVPWPQYWAWRLCGVAASEVSSLGCHTDLWQPMTASFSALAIRRGWAARMAPLHRADAQLGMITAQVHAQTGLPMNCSVFCGLHDSNAALLAARGHREIAEGDATVLSTGTWFVAMRSLNKDITNKDTTNKDTMSPAMLSEARDCLVNVDVHGQPVPSARFMGGREAELIGGINSFAVTDNYQPTALMARLPALIAGGAAVFPSFVSGVGPFPWAVGEWRNKPVDAGDQRAIAALYLALMADTSLDLIGSRDRLLIEGRFAEDILFVRALAALRPQQCVFISNAHQDVAYGALRLIDPRLPPPATLTPVEPLQLDLSAFATEWRSRALASQSAA